MINVNISLDRSSRDKREKKYEDSDRKSRSYLDTRERRKKTRWDEETDDSERGQAGNHSKDHDGRATKTLDGKTAGFQAAKALREETEAYKRQEAEHFSKVMFFIAWRCIYRSIYLFMEATDSISWC